MQDRLTLDAQRRQQLKDIETTICRLVCSVHGVVSRELIETRDRLRNVTGLEYDAINGHFRRHD